MLTLSLITAFASAADVAVGNVLYHGRVYRNATATTQTNYIFIQSPTDGGISIPVDSAPKPLLAKLGDPVAKAALVETPSALGEVEVALGKRYGHPQAAGTPIAPATKALIFRTETLSIEGHLVANKAELFAVTRRGGTLSQTEADTFLTQCGGTWVKLLSAPYPLTAMWAREDGALATLSGKTLYVQSSAFPGRPPERRDGREAMHWSRRGRPPARRHSVLTRAASWSAHLPQPSWKPIFSCAAQSAALQWRARAV